PMHSSIVKFFIHTRPNKCGKTLPHFGGRIPVSPTQHAMKTVTSFLLLLIFASVGLSADDARKNQEDDVREAVFRWQFEHNASGQQKKAKAYYLQIGEKGDPSDAFMKRFAEHKSPVRKVSACTADSGKGVLDKKTGERGLIFRVTSIEWKSDTEVDVKGGYYEGGLNASGNTYTVKKENGKWKVTNDKMHWIS
ncbi:MAG: hypothetical protein CMN21_14010, partial [Rubinisphaera sp.]|uniref:hypothetical protein n=1 Tax=Rubinisphaera sp. TaxID=2024857 RepID=UPI000C11F697